MRLVSTPWLFHVPGLRKFDGYATWTVIFLRKPLAQTSDDLVTHELCHVWQMQHRPLHMPLSYIWRRYAANPYEVEARAAARLTSDPAPPAR